ncbi:MAG: lipocalin-like domain-containing protein [Microcoleus sp.]
MVIGYSIALPKPERLKYTATVFLTELMMSVLSAEKNPLVGTWKLIGASAIDPNGSVESEPYGANPNGYITYTRDGHMMVMFSRSDRLSLSKDVRSPFSQEMRSIPIAELARAFITFNAYAGRYTLSGNTVTHHVEVASIPNRIGTDLVRTFTLSGDRIVLKTPPTIADGIPKVFELVWQRVDPQ